MNHKRIHQTYQVSLTASDMIYRVGRLFRRRAEVFFREHGLDLTPEQWGLLLRIAETENQSQGDLADPVLRDYPNVTRMLDGLEKKALVKRSPDPDDRRKTLISLTSQGKNLLDEYIPMVVEEKGRYFEGLDQRDVNRLREILAVIEKNLVEP